MGLTAGTLFGHERRDVGDYQFVVAWIGEPAFEGLKNGLDLRVSRIASEEPVEGLEETLQVELTHVPSDASQVMDLRTIFRDPDHYTADIIATAPGVYQMRVFGSIEGTQVDEVFISKGGGGNFGDMESSADLQFPETLPQVREIEGEVRGAQTTAQQAQIAPLDADYSASTANTLAIVGVVLGAIGIITGGGGVMLAMKRR